MLKYRYYLTKAIKQNIAQRSYSQKYQLKQYQSNSSYLNIERQQEH